MNFLDTCRELLAIDSSRSRGTYDSAEYVYKLAQRFGMESSLVSETYEGLHQAYVIIAPEKNLKNCDLLLMSHLDTRDPGSYHEWTSTRENPFDSTIANKEIYGLGANSGKVDVLCKLFALKELYGKKMSHPWALVTTYGRHHNMEGASRFLRRGVFKPKQALIGEPTNLNLTISGRGRAVVEILVPFSTEERDLRIRHDFEESSSSRTRLFSAPSASPSLNENPIMKMLEFIDNLPGGILFLEAEGGRSPFMSPESVALEFDLCGSLSESVVTKLTKMKRLILELEEKVLEHSAKGERAALQLGSIRTTEEGVVLSGFCDLTSNLNEPVYSEWLNHLRDKTRELGANFQLVDYKHPFKLGELEALFTLGSKIAKKNGLRAEATTINTCCEASVLARRDIKCLVFGPGQGVGNSHSEWISSSKRSG